MKNTVCEKKKNRTAQIETRQITTSELLAEGEERLSTKQISGKIHRTNSTCSTLAGKNSGPCNHTNSLGRRVSPLALQTVGHRYAR